MTPELIAKFGVSTVLLASVLWLLRMFVVKSFSVFDKMIDNQNEERKTWQESQAKYMDKIDRSMDYQKSEHQAMMSILMSIEKKVEQGICKVEK